MPAYPWLASTLADAEVMPAHMRALRTVGVPYSDDDIAASVVAVKGQTEVQALVAYLQNVGHSGEVMQASMNFDINVLRSLVTVVSFVAFIGIVLWVYARRNVEDF